MGPEQACVQNSAAPFARCRSSLSPRGSVKLFSLSSQIYKLLAAQPSCATKWKSVRGTNDQPEVQLWRQPINKRALAQFYSFLNSKDYCIWMCDEQSGGFWNMKINIFAPHTTSCFTVDWLRLTPNVWTVTSEINGNIRSTIDVQ